MIIRYKKNKKMACYDSENLTVGVRELQEMVELVNQTEVSQNDYLSDSVYRYDSQKQSLSIAEENDLQQGMKPMQ